MAGEGSGSSGKAPAYFERQRLQRCLQHTLNNLLQRPAVTAADLDGLAAQLAPPGRNPLAHLFHPHRTLFLGNWDVNVLELALRLHCKELQWHDLRDKAFQRLDLDGCFGLIVNVRADGLMSQVLRGRHWIALRRIGGRWYNLDSNLPAPRLVAACCSEADAGSSGQGPEPPAECAEAEGAEAGEGAAAAAAGADEGSSMAAADAGASASDAAATPEAAAPTSDAAATPDEAAPDAAAVRRFLAEMVRDRDGKVFKVVDSPLASHPLPSEEEASPVAAPPAAAAGAASDATAASDAAVTDGR